MPEYITGTPKPPNPHGSLARDAGRLTQHSESMGVGAPTDMELLAAWMVGHGMATGHADDMAALIGELDWQVQELRDKIWELEKPEPQEAQNPARRMTESD